MHHYILRAVGGLTCLTDLIFQWSSCTDVGFCALASLTNLRFLDLGFSDLTDVALSSFRTLVHLECLDLCCNRRITGTGFRDLSALAVLHTLDLSSCYGLTNNGVRECARAFKALRDLAIGDENDADRRHTQLTSVAWRYLATYASPTLTTLDLCQFELTAADMARLARFEVRV